MKPLDYALSTLNCVAAELAIRGMTEQADTIRDVMDQLVGWCAPGMSLHDALLEAEFRLAEHAAGNGGHAEPHERR